MHLSNILNVNYFFIYKEIYGNLKNVQRYQTQLEENNKVKDHNISRFSIMIKDRKEVLKKTEKKFKKL